ncbi:aldehyde dehydrogenase family protein [Streptomyces griseoruber]
MAHGPAEDVNRAVATARRAFTEGPWSRMTPSERSGLVWRIGDRILERAADFAQLEALDNGKSAGVAQAVGVTWAADIFHYYAGWATKVEGRTIPVSVPWVPGAEWHAYTLREPVGVCAQIIPWNFPLLMAAFKVAPALATGNTVILKPAEQTPLTALLLGEIIQELDVPPGVFNIVTGFGEAGAALASHDDVDKVAFTGSTEVGKKIVDAARGNLNKVSLELGGKSPNIVFADADLEAAVSGSAGAWLFNHGQCCVADTRLFVEDKIFDEFTQAVADFAAQAKLGPGLGPATEVGPLIDQDQADRVTGYLRQGLADGARALTGGGRHGDTGFYVQPTVLVDVKPEFSVVREEIFGPVVVAQPFSTDDGVVRQANDTDFGLAAGVWTREHLQGPPHRPPTQGRHGLGQHVQRLRHGTPLRRVQAVRLGAGTRRGRHRSLHPGQGREHPVVRGVRPSAGLGGTASPTGASGPWCRPCTPATAPSWPRPASRSWAVGSPLRLPRASEPTACP